MHSLACNRDGNFWTLRERIASATPGARSGDLHEHLQERDGYIPSSSSEAAPRPPCRAASDQNLSLNCTRFLEPSFLRGPRKHTSVHQWRVATCRKTVASLGIPIESSQKVNFAIIVSQLFGCQGGRPSGQLHHGSKDRPGEAALAGKLITALLGQADGVRP